MGRLCRCGHPLHPAQCCAGDGCWCDSFAPAPLCPDCYPDDPASNGNPLCADCAGFRDATLESWERANGPGNGTASD